MHRTYEEMFQNMSLCSVHSLTLELNTSQMGVTNVPIYSVLYPKQHVVPVKNENIESDLLQ
jgi:hypothetical protein